MAWPLSMPAGMLTCDLFLPAHAAGAAAGLAGLMDDLARAADSLGQAVVVAEGRSAPPPRWMRTWPVPWQSGQTSAVVPGSQPVPLQVVAVLQCG